MKFYSQKEIFPPNRPSELHVLFLSTGTSSKALLVTLSLIGARCDQAETAKPVPVMEGGPVMLLVAIHL